MFGCEIVFYFGFFTKGPKLQKVLVLQSFLSRRITAPSRPVPVTAQHRDSWVFCFVFFCIRRLMKKLVLPHYAFAFHLPKRTC